ncbi:MAG TPA: A/G-specific adenine glycosylase, partial [Pseudonocardiaceae bacterium]|nr:A/G-specific adenine glycosylase [Pseudonocardiaceae bacterium]
MNAAQLVAWFDAEARDLPWRAPGTTPWGVLVSEVMLQQTPVQRVAPVWIEWMLRWPNPSSLAAESAGTVVRAWGKLGYPRRALRLHATATAIAAQHDDVVPADVDGLLALPGIGAYTARAVAAFGYGHRVPVVDTNVRRVVARALHGMADSGPPSTSRDLSDVDKVLPGAQAARFSAALMEL